MADRKITAMHKEYGKAHGLTCKNCPNLECREMPSGRWYYKCRAYGTSRADSTDWAMKAACELIQVAAVCGKAMGDPVGEDKS